MDNVLLWYNFNKICFYHQDEISDFLCTVLTTSVSESFDRSEFDVDHRKKKEKDKDRKKRVHRDLSLELKGRKTPPAGRGRRSSLPTTPGEVRILIISIPNNWFSCFFFLWFVYVFEVSCLCLKIHSSST